jgi:pyridoxal phosphate enzyme (YggS family)
MCPISSSPDPASPDPASPDPAGTDRRSELAESLAALRDRLAAAVAHAGRPADSLTLIAVTKTFPASDVAILAGLGIRDVGENRDQEARAKLAELAEPANQTELTSPALTGLNWHFVGQLQTNKARNVARYATAVHSLDRVELAEALDTAARRHDRVLEVFIQVSLDGVDGRGGAVPDEVSALAARVAELSGLRLAGVMAVAPLGGDAESAFARLAAVSHQLRTEIPSATAISAGMSGDFEIAVAHGATHVRIGSALLGRRAQSFR